MATYYRSMPVARFADVTVRIGDLPEVQQALATLKAAQIGTEAAHRTRYRLVRRMLRRGLLDEAIDLCNGALKDTEDPM